MLKQEYLGDGLYVEFDGYQFRLYTDPQTRGRHEVYLEPAVLASFIRARRKAARGPVMKDVPRATGRPMVKTQAR